MKSKRRMRLYGFVAAAGLVLFGALLIGINALTSDRTVERGIAPSPVDERAAEAARQEAAYMGDARQAAAEAAREAAAKEAAAKEAAAKEAAAKEAAERQAASRESDSPPQAAVPPDTTMYLTIPKIGLQDVLVQDGISEVVLSQGVGHLPGTGYPWIEGSNTYIPGHRIGYPGTGSDLVFWELPSLVAGDEVILEDSLGQVYTYRVTEVFAVTPLETWVTPPIAGKDMVTLQTCTESVTDWWTVGPQLMSSGPGSGRLIVRAERVS